MNNDTPQLISRKRHYSYVLVFSITICLFLAEVAGGLIPGLYINLKECDCGRDITYLNLNFIIFGAGGVIWGFIMSFPLNRFMLVANVKPDAERVRLSRWACYGKKLLGWWGLAAIILIAGAFISAELVSIHFTEKRFEKHHNYNFGALHCAVVRCDVRAVQGSIKSGADVNAKDKWDRTPLHFAAGGNHTNIIMMLLEAGADVDGNRVEGTTPLHLAVYYGQNDAALCLISCGADISIIDDEDTMLHIAAVRRNKDVVQSLLDKGAPINKKGFRGKTPLHYATEYNHISIIKLLLDRGADVNVKDDNGKTPLDGAIVDIKMEAANLLRSHSAKTGEELKKEAGE